MDTEDEARAIQDICTRLRTRFPATPPDTVQQTVGTAYDSLRTARIRDFVPVLVEREARDRLAAMA